MRSAPSVLHVVQPNDGGVAEHVLMLATGLAERGFRVEVALAPGSVIAGGLEAAGIPLHRVEMTREPGGADVRAARALRAIDRGGGYDLVHAHSSKAGALARLALPRARRRVVYTPHCFAFAAAFSTPRRRAYRVIEQLLVARTARIVAVSEWEQELGRRCLAGAAARTSVIENGVRECPGSAPDPQLVEFAGGRPLAGLVSVLRPQKEPLRAVRAMARVESGRMAIVGNGELRDDVVAEIDRLGLGDRVRWFPFRGEVGPYLAALDLFVLPSAWESFPYSVLEALSCGVPVLATRVGGVPEAVLDGRTGRLVESGDDEALAAELEALLADPARCAEMGAAGREQVERRFGLERSVERTAALYRELVR